MTVAATLPVLLEMPVLGDSLFYITIPIIVPVDAAALEIGEWELGSVTVQYEPTGE